VGGGEWGRVRPGTRPLAFPSGSASTYAAALFAGESSHRVLRARVRLQGQRFIGRQHLHQEGQCVAEATTGGRSQLSVRVGSAGCPAETGRPRRSPAGRDRQGACPATAQLPGCAVGLGPPVDSTSAVREPMHRSVPLRVAGALDLTSNQSQVHGRHLQPHGQQRQLLLRAAGPQTGACGVIGPSEISGTSSSPPITSTWLRPVSRATTTDRSAVGSTKVRTRCGSALVT
jgi:hypothetical protein